MSFELDSTIVCRFLKDGQSKWLKTERNNKKDVSVTRPFVLRYVRDCEGRPREIGQLGACKDKLEQRLHNIDISSCHNFAFAINGDEFMHKV